MKDYLLDSTVLIDISRGQKTVTDWLLQIIKSGRRVYISPTTVAEFMSGIPKSKRNQIIKLLRTYPLLPLDGDSSAEAGSYRFDQARKGYTLSVPDAIQAVLALRYDLVLATSNPKHFPGVRTFDPRGA